MSQKSQFIFDYKANDGRSWACRTEQKRTRKRILDRVFPKCDWDYCLFWFEVLMDVILVVYI